MKICGKCKEEKALTEYASKNRLKGTYSSECKECHKIMRNQYYKNNTEQEKHRVKEVKRRNIKWYKNLKSSLSCKECGESHPATLHFHHLDLANKSFSISQAVGRNLSRNKILSEIAKCDILCANCHAKKHWHE